MRRMTTLPVTPEHVAQGTGMTPQEAQQSLDYLTQRGYIRPLGRVATSTGSATAWQLNMPAPNRAARRRKGGA